MPQITCCEFKVQHCCLHCYHAFEISVDYERWQIAVVTQHFRGAAVKEDCIYFPLFYFPFYLPCFSLPPLPSLAHVINSWSKTEVSEFHPTVPDQRDEYELLKGLSPFQSHFSNTVFLTALRLEKCFAAKQALKSL